MTKIIMTMAAAIKHIKTNFNGTNSVTIHQFSANVLVIAQGKGFYV